MPSPLLVRSFVLISLALHAHAGTARADLSACGDIHVEAMAECQVIAPGVECEGMCTPVSVRAACAAKLDAACGGTCKDLPSADCQGECGASCDARCDKLEPGEFDCEADCKADCSGTCAARCETADNAARCEASCTASCDAECQGSCDIELPEADCDAGCEASCEGSCDVDANFDCQVECQAEGFAECETDVEGGCDIACEGEEGALFCDGQYVDHGDNLAECIDALEAALNLKVETHAEAACEGNRCEARAGAKISSGGVSCAAAGARRPGLAGAWFVTGALAWLFARARRR
jgi:hypothetical protein